MRLVSADGWLLAVGGALGSPGKTIQRTGGFADFIYRNLLAPTPSRMETSDEMDPRLRDADLVQVLAGTLQLTADVQITAPAPGFGGYYGRRYFGGRQFGARYFGSPVSWSLTQTISPR